MGKEWRAKVNVALVDTTHLAGTKVICFSAHDNNKLMQETTSCITMLRWPRGTLAKPDFYKLDF